jgi:hypothetical protein
VVAPKVVVPPGAAEETPDAGSETDLGVARTVPLDPRGGPDTALSIAYQIVTGTLTRSAANAEAASATAAALSAKPAATTLPPAAPSATSKATPKK